MAILSIGNPFGATDTVTSTKLNNIANAAEFDDPVDETTLEKHTDGKLRIKANGVGTTQIAPSAVTFSKLDDVIDDDTMATASATTLATSESIKAYTDGLIGTADKSDDSGLVAIGEQGSLTLGGGLIIKFGTVNSTSSSTPFTFQDSSGSASPFPNGIYGITVTPNNAGFSTAQESAIIGGNLTVDGATIITAQNNSGAAIGRCFFVAYGY